MKAYLEGRTDGYEATYRLRTKNGSYQWTHDRGLIVARDEQNNPERVIGTVREVDSDHCKD